MARCYERMNDIAIKQIEIQLRETIEISTNIRAYLIQIGYFGGLNMHRLIEYAIHLKSFHESILIISEIVIFNTDSELSAFNLTNNFVRNHYLIP